MSQFYSMMSPVGRLNLVMEENVLQEVDIKPGATRQPQTTRKPDKAFYHVEKQLQRYFNDAKTSFTLEVNLQGTDFQKKVWRALQKIPSGEVRTYGQIARKLHSSAQAVGNACRENPVPIVIPCHRVVSAQGLGGYAGKTAGKQLAVKRWLLEHEGVDIDALSGSK